jgi:hypothetical protein
MTLLNPQPPLPVQMEEGKRGVALYSNAQAASKRGVICAGCSAISEEACRLKYETETRALDIIPERWNGRKPTFELLHNLREAASH